MGYRHKRCRTSSKEVFCTFLTGLSARTNSSNNNNNNNNNMNGIDIRPIEVALFHEDGHDEAESLFLKCFLCERA